jgi:hypothetical protein
LNICVGRRLITLFGSCITEHTIVHYTYVTTTFSTVMAQQWIMFKYIIKKPIIHNLCLDPLPIQLCASARSFIVTSDH